MRHWHDIAGPARVYGYITLAYQHANEPACARSRYFPISRIFLLIQVDQARRLVVADVKLASDSESVKHRPGVNLTGRLK